MVFSVTLSGLSLSAGYFVAGCEGSNELVARVVAVEAILSNRSPGGRQPISTEKELTGVASHSGDRPTVDTFIYDDEVGSPDMRCFTAGPKKLQFGRVGL